MGRKVSVAEAIQERVWGVPFPGIGSAYLWKVRWPRSMGKGCGIFLFSVPCFLLVTLLVNLRLCLMKAKYQRDCNMTFDETKVRRLMSMGLDVTVLPPQTYKRPEKSTNETSAFFRRSAAKRKGSLPTKTSQGEKRVQGYFWDCKVQEQNCQGRFGVLSILFANYWLGKIFERNPSRKSQNDETKIERLTEVMGAYSITRAKGGRILSSVYLQITKNFMKFALYQPLSTIPPRILQASLMCFIAAVPNP